MNFNFKILILLITIILLGNKSIVQANIDTTFSTDIVKTEQVEQSTNLVFKNKFSSAIRKFENLNIKISYEDLNKLINQNSNNDFYLLLIADKTAELGFFDLSEKAFQLIKDVDISKINYDNTSRFYYPQNKINKSDTIVLAELYSSIVYNDQSKESINELAQYQRLLRNYDYANYLMALGYYKLNDIENAQKYITTAIKINNQNINYKILESKILSNYKKGKISLKILKEINNKKISSYSLTNKINAANEYTLYLSAKKPFDKDYHLGKYYFSEGDYLKSIRILQSATSKNTKKNAALYSLMSRCYFAQGDYDKAIDFAQKAYKTVKDNPDCLITLGDIENKNGHYKNAIKYYREASLYKPIRKEILEKMASIYTKAANTKKANEIYKELIKNYSNSYIAYYKTGLSDNDNLDNIKKSISLNIMFQDGWIDLARIMLDKGNIEQAKNYLSVANYLDDNSFRYYYYQSLLKKKDAETKNLKNDNNSCNKVAESSLE